MWNAAVKSESAGGLVRRKAKMAAVKTRKRTNSLKGEIYFDKGAGLTRVEVMRTYDSDVRRVRDERLKNVELLAAHTEEIMSKQPDPVQVNSECVFFNSKHSKHVQNLTRKQVLQGLQKNYTKFVEHFARGVVEHPKLAKSQLQEDKKKENEEIQAHINTEFHVMAAQRPHSVTYHPEDHAPDWRLTGTQLSSEFTNQPKNSLLTQAELDTIMNKRIDSGISVRQRFAPKIKTLKDGLPKIKEAALMHSDASIVKVDTEGFKDYKQRQQDEFFGESSQPAVRQRSQETKVPAYVARLAGGGSQIAGVSHSLPKLSNRGDIAARMASMYKSRHGDALVDLEMQKRIRGEMYKKVYSRFQIPEDEDKATWQELDRRYHLREEYNEPFLDREKDRIAETETNQKLHGLIKKHEAKIKQDYHSKKMFNNGYYLILALNRQQKENVKKKINETNRFSRFKVSVCEERGSLWWLLVGWWLFARVIITPPCFSQTPHLPLCRRQLRSQGQFRVHAEDEGARETVEGVVVAGEEEDPGFGVDGAAACAQQTALEVELDFVLGQPHLAWPGVQGSLQIPQDQTLVPLLGLVQRVLLQLVPLLDARRVLHQLHHALEIHSLHCVQQRRVPLLVRQIQIRSPQDQVLHYHRTVQIRRHSQRSLPQLQVHGSVDVETLVQHFFQFVQIISTNHFLNPISLFSLDKSQPVPGVFSCVEAWS